MSKKVKLELETRRAVEADIPDLIDLAQRSWLSGNCERAPIEVIRDWVAEDFERSRYPEIWPQVTVATHRDQIVGLSSVDGQDVADLWVHPSFQRRGIGRLLIEISEKEICNAGYDVARLMYTEYNVAASQFYPACGYREVSRASYKLPCGIERMTIVMEKQLLD